MRCITEECFGLGYIKRPAFSKKIDPSPVNGGFNSQGNTDLLAEAAGQLKGQCGNMDFQLGTVVYTGNCIEQGIQLKIFISADYKGFAYCFLPFRSKNKPIHQIINIDHVIIYFPGSDHRRHLLNRQLEELQQPHVTGAIDCSGAYHGQGKIIFPGKLMGKQLPFQFCSLVNIGRCVGRILPRRRFLDITMHTHGAAMHKSFNTIFDRGLQEVTGALDMDIPVILINGTGCPEHCGNIKNLFTSGDCPFH